MSVINLPNSNSLQMNLIFLQTSFISFAFHLQKRVVNVTPFLGPQFRHYFLTLFLDSIPLETLLKLQLPVASEVYILDCPVPFTSLSFSLSVYAMHMCAYGSEISDLWTALSVIRVRERVRPCVCACLLASHSRTTNMHVREHMYAHTDMYIEACSHIRLPGYRT
jgi:hypothetical protein